MWAVVEEAGGGIHWSVRALADTVAHILTQTTWATRHENSASEGAAQDPCFGRFRPVPAHNAFRKCADPRY